MNWSLAASRGLHTMDARHENREEIPEDEYEDGAERSFEKDTIALVQSQKTAGEFFKTFRYDRA